MIEEIERKVRLLRVTMDAYVSNITDMIEEIHCMLFRASEAEKLEIGRAYAKETVESSRLWKEVGLPAPPAPAPRASGKEYPDV